MLRKEERAAQHHRQAQLARALVRAHIDSGAVLRGGHRRRGATSPSPHPSPHPLATHPQQAPARCAALCRALTQLAPFLAPCSP